MKTTQELLDSLLAHKASINHAGTEQKNQALRAMADQLLTSSTEILKANVIDMENAQESISKVMQDRLLLTKERIIAMAEGIRALIDLEDPVGLILEEKVREDGLSFSKQSIPFGLIGMIYESRPNVTSDVAALAIKSGNAVILRGGKEAFHSAQAIVRALKVGLSQAGLAPEVIELVQDTSRTSAEELMTAKGKIDLLVPRGGAG